MICYQCGQNSLFPLGSAQTSRLCRPSLTVRGQIPGPLEEPFSPPGARGPHSPPVFTPSPPSRGCLLKAPFIFYYPFPLRKQQPRIRNNQDPLIVCLEGFISIQLHSRASRFLISHVTIKDEGQGRAAGRGLVGNAPGRAAHLCPGGDSGMAAGDPLGPSQQPTEEGHSETSPTCPILQAATANCDNRSKGLEKTRNGAKTDFLYRGREQGSERAVVWPQSHSKAPAPSVLTRTQACHLSSMHCFRLLNVGVSPSFSLWWGT